MIISDTVYVYFLYSIRLFLIQYRIIFDTVYDYFCLIQYMIISDTVYDYF